MAALEHKLQSQCFIWHWNEHPEERGRLFSTFQEASSRIEGTQKKALGLVRGVSDFIYVNSEGRMIGIELKEKGTRHDTNHLREQAEWLLSVPFKGWFCDSLQMFQDIISGKDGIRPEDVLSWMGGKQGSIKWEI